MSRRFLVTKGVLYIGFGAASPMLLEGHQIMAAIQTALLIAAGIYSMVRGLAPPRVPRS